MKRATLAQSRFRTLLAHSRLFRPFAFAAIIAALTASAAAQNNLSLGSSERTELLFLGTSGGPPLRANRSEPSTLLIVDGRPYLIDCGIGTMKRLLQAHIDSERITTIFFTHLHADHDLGLADVMGNDFFRLRAASSNSNIQIYGPPQTKLFVDVAFHYITFGFRAFAAEPDSLGPGATGTELKSPFVAHEIQADGLAYQDDKIRVIAGENAHYALMPAESRRRMKSFSYRIETPHGVIVFTGDTGPSDAVARLAKGADVLVTEVHDSSQIANYVKAMVATNHWPPQRAAWFIAHARQEHMDEKEVGDLASKAQVKSVVLYHYNPINPADYVAKVKTYFSGPVFASADLERYCLDNAETGGAEKQPALRLCGKPPVDQPKGASGIR